MLRFERPGSAAWRFGTTTQGNNIFDRPVRSWLIHGASRAWSQRPRFLPAGGLLAMATIESAGALCADDLIGSLEVGKAADLVLLDGNAPHLLAQHSLASDLVRFATRGEVKAAIVGGRVLYQDGAFKTIDMDRLRADARRRGRLLVRSIVEERRCKPFPAFWPNPNVKVRRSPDSVKVVVVVQL